MHVHEFAMKLNEALGLEHKVSIMQVQGFLEAIAQDIDIAEHVLSLCQSCHGIGLELPAEVLDQEVAGTVHVTPTTPHPVVSHPTTPPAPVKPPEPVKAPEPVKEPVKTPEPVKEPTPAPKPAEPAKAPEPVKAEEPAKPATPATEPARPQETK